MFEWINVAFDICNKSVQYLRNQKCQKNITIDLKIKTLNSKEKSKIKYDYFEIFEWK